MKRFPYSRRAIRCVAIAAATLTIASACTNGGGPVEPEHSQPQLGTTLIGSGNAVEMDSIFHLKATLEHSPEHPTQRGY